jgi:membrane protease subunit HflC
MKRILLSILAVALALAFVRASFYTVDAAEYVYVTLLGEHRATFDGSDSVSGAGLKFGWPWPIQQVQRLDRRLQQFDLPPMDQLTYDPDGKNADKILSVEAYVCWKIVDDKHVDRFVKRVGSADRARTILAPLIVSQLGAAVSEMRMESFVNTHNTVDASIESLRKRLLAQLRDPMRDDYGIALVDIRLRRFNHPASVRGSIFARIEAERRKEAQKYVAEGERLANNKLNEADAEIREQLARAKSEEVRLMSEADAEAMKIRNSAYTQDREFYKFTLEMDRLQSIVGGQRTMLLLSTHRPAFERLFAPPRPDADPKKTKKEAD